MRPEPASASTSTSSSTPPNTSPSGAQSPELLAVARVIGVHGLHGELVCELHTDFPERFKSTRELLVGSPPIPRRVERHRIQRGRLVVKLAEVDDRDAALSLRGTYLQVPVREAVPLPEGRYYWHQIIGLRVESGDGRPLGTITDILETGSNDVYVVRQEGRELLIPALKDIIRTVDLEAGKMAVELPPGLES